MFTCPPQALYALSSSCSSRLIESSTASDDNGQPLQEEMLCDDPSLADTVTNDAEKNVMSDDDDVTIPDEPFKLCPHPHLDFSYDEVKGSKSTPFLVSHTVEQKTHVELLHILDKAECPDYLFKDIIDWAFTAKQNGYNFSPCVSTRAAVLKDLRR